MYSVLCFWFFFESNIGSSLHLNHFLDSFLLQQLSSLLLKLQRRWQEEHLVLKVLYFPFERKNPFFPCFLKFPSLLSILSEHLFLKLLVSFQSFVSTFSFVSFLSCDSSLWFETRDFGSTSSTWRRTSGVNGLKMDNLNLTLLSRRERDCTQEQRHFFPPLPFLSTALILCTMSMT